jgi:hypothetical protein
MSWHVHLAQFFGGAFFANSLPHLIAGVSGHRLPTPFASPPFKGLSSPAVNVVWALANLVVAYVLLAHVAALDWQSALEVAVTFAGFGAMSLLCARSLGRHRSGDRSA